MRRASAMLLVAWFSVLLIAPAVFAARGDLQLPACCRLKGSHHCVLMNRHFSSTAPEVRAARCPMFPVGTTLPASPTIGVLNTARVVFAGIASHPAVHAQTEALYRISHSRSGQKRGPPARLA